jgi:hypothetical protein
MVNVTENRRDARRKREFTGAMIDEWQALFSFRT